VNDAIIPDRRDPVRTGEQVHSELPSTRTAFRGLTFPNSRFEWGSSNKCKLPSRYC